MNPVPIKVLVEQLQLPARTTDSKMEPGFRLILLTDTDVLKALLSQAETEGYAKHEIVSPGSRSGLDEILLEVVTPGGPRDKTKYVETVKQRSHNIIQVMTL